ncbi:MAG: UvrD-helicase domain-containing protein [Solirubrobacteraceae bacterium]
MTARAFDLSGPLPSGTTVLEASAGTGKTFTIAGLAARYVAEGTPLDRLLLVTFTRMATGELRERVRERLTEVQRALAAGETGDPLVELLAREDREQRCLNLARAVADFDAATIETTHAFCQEMLGCLGIAADLEPDVTFVEDVRDLRAEVVDDLFVRRFADRSNEKPPFNLAEVRQIAEAATGNPVTPLADGPGGIAAMRRGIATWSRDELKRRKRRMTLVTYDDLLTHLRDALANDPEAVARLHARFDVVLVDEFQDTDPVQWEILQRAFTQPSPAAAAGTGGDRTLVLIGDPKQAIYAFRGGDVYAYLDAAGQTAERQTLGVNHRSDQRLIDAYDALFGDSRLGHPDIAYLRVTAKHKQARLAGAGSPLRIRVVDREDLSELTNKGYARVGPAREHVAADVAQEVVGLLDGEARIEGEPVQPGDIAVLVPTNRRAAEVRDALEAADVPAVINGAGSVFGTTPAAEWLQLLEALERPGTQLRAHAAALTCFLGWDAKRVAGASASEWEDVHRRLHDWARVLRVRGVASLMETMTLAERLPERVLAEAGGERRLTDLRHIAQLLHAAASAEQLGTTALTAWLRRRVAEAAEDTADEDRSRRLESDAQAVQVLTVHRSKGLEFPIVLLPFMWDSAKKEDNRKPVVFHDATGQRTLDVSMAGPAFAAHKDRWLLEERGEALRLLYVALTRARHQAVVWWAASWDSRNSPLGRLMFARDEEGNVAHEGKAPPTDPEALAAFGELAERAGDCIAVERSSLGADPRWSGPPAAHATLAAARFDRSLDWWWRRTSYSDITSGTHEAAVASEPEVDAVDDEPEAGVANGLWADVPFGMRVGTTVHRALERMDFAAPEFGPELVELGAVPGLQAALATPLGEPFGVSLADIGAADRLDELEFELPLAGGDEPAGEVTLDRVATALGDELAGYAPRLQDAGLRTELRGFLTGSLDLVARLPGPRFAVFDYKTNALDSFAPDALAAELHRRHYGLQALLYAVALHRYLRWRLPGYDPATHLAGVGYLFLRGMDGKSSAGVLAWTPPATTIEALSDALDG